MRYSFENINPLDYKPRLIIWEVSCNCFKNKTGVEPFTTKESFAVLDSIAELSRPIVVLASNYEGNPPCDPLDRPDIIDIILYGNSIGLKMIVETTGDKLNKDFRNVLRTIGTKSIRILVNNKIKESIEHGFEQSEEFLALQKLLTEVKHDGFEIQLGLPINKFDEREIAYEIDFAVRKNARGIYFHLVNSDIKSKKKKDINQFDKEAVIMWIARQKRLLPDEMYFSPQCVRYGIKHIEDEDHDVKESCNNERSRIGHWCLGGKTFAFISATGKVQICSALKNECGNLRNANFSFSKIWHNSDIFNWVRCNNFTCSQVQKTVDEPIPKRRNYTQILEHLEH